ncbi:MAG TPA: excinuclease ABC subunit UvrC [Caldisericia bacterium]|nr:excinuclease ABC subunit UvrC [Caldisericia bacterium]
MELKEKGKTEKLRAEVRNFPNAPGIYIWRSNTMEVLYVGKATSLQKRVSSYFSHAKQDPKIAQLIAEAHTIDIILTNSPYEALLLESNFIKRYLPPFNIRLKDAKSYQYLCISKDAFPVLKRVRQLQNKDKAHYFGPYTSGKDIVALFSLISKTFQLRTCKQKILKTNTKRSCLNYFIGKCSGPCDNHISKEDYTEKVRQALLFLRQDYHLLKKLLHQQMLESAKKENFEYAALLRDRMFSLDTLLQKQRVIYPQKIAQDVFALYTFGNQACIDMMKIREGKLIFEDHFMLEIGLDEAEEQILASFISQYYFQISAGKAPKEILLSHLPPEEEKLLPSLREHFQTESLSILKPQRGKKFDIMKICLKNARQHLELNIKPSENDLKQIRPVLLEMQKRFSLPAVPFQIEGYDVSHVSGKATTVSMVRFENAQANKKFYRYFRIKTIDKPDDPGSLREALNRRLQHTDEKFGAFPDLFLIDGGIAQFNTAQRIVSEKQASISVLSLAKREELVYFDSHQPPLRMNKEDPVLRLLQHIRDESHRFARKHATKKYRKIALEKK